MAVVDRAHTIPWTTIKPPEPLKVARKIFLNEDVFPWMYALCGEARSILGIAKPYFQMHPAIHRGFAATQFTTAFTMPLSLYGIINGIAGLVSDKSKEALIDNSLGLVGNISDIIDGATTFTGAVVELEAAAAHTLQWAGPLAVAASLASSVYFAIHGRGLYYCNKILKELTTTAPDQLPVLVRKHSYHLSSQCGVDPDLLKKVINRIYQNPSSSEEKQKQMTKVSAALKKRIQHKRISHALSIIVIAIGIIATLILFATSVLSWGIAASALLGIMFAAGMGKMGFEIYANRRFKKTCELRP